MDNRKHLPPTDHNFSGTLVDDFSFLDEGPTFPDLGQFEDDVAGLDKFSALAQDTSTTGEQYCPVEEGHDAIHTGEVENIPGSQSRLLLESTLDTSPSQTKETFTSYEVSQPPESWPGYNRNTIDLDALIDELNQGSVYMVNPIEQSISTDPSRDDSDCSGPESLHDADLMSHVQKLVVQLRSRKDRLTVITPLLSPKLRKKTHEAAQVLGLAYRSFGSNANKRVILSKCDFARARRRQLSHSEFNCEAQWMSGVADTRIVCFWIGQAGSMIPTIACRVNRSTQRHAPHSSSTASNFGAENKNVPTSIRQSNEVIWSSHWPSVSSNVHMRETADVMGMDHAAEPACVIVIGSQHYNEASTLEHQSLFISPFLKWNVEIAMRRAIELGLGKLSLPPTLNDVHKWCTEDTKFKAILKWTIESAVLRAVQLGKLSLPAASDDVHRWCTEDARLKIILKSVLNIDATDNETAMFRYDVLAAESRLRRSVSNNSSHLMDNKSSQQNSLVSLGIDELNEFFEQAGLVKPEKLVENHPKPCAIFAYFTRTVDALSALNELRERCVMSNGTNTVVNAELLYFTDDSVLTRFRTIFDLPEEANPALKSNPNHSNAQPKTMGTVSGQDLTENTQASSAHTPLRGDPAQNTIPMKRKRSAGNTKDWKCPHPGCDRTFCTYADCRKHQQVHQERPHICQICEKAFLYAKDLRRHEDNVHNKNAAR